jgi:hypothetical protein
VKNNSRKYSIHDENTIAVFKVDKTTGKETFSWSEALLGSEAWYM